MLPDSEVSSESQHRFLTLMRGGSESDEEGEKTQPMGLGAREKSFLLYETIYFFLIGLS